MEIKRNQLNYCLKRELTSFYCKEIVKIIPDKRKYKKMNAWLYQQRFRAERLKKEGWSLLNRLFSEISSFFTGVRRVRGASFPDLSCGEWCCRRFSTRQLKDGSLPDMRLGLVRKYCEYAYEKGAKDDRSWHPLIVYFFTYYCWSFRVSFWFSISVHCYLAVGNSSAGWRSELISFSSFCMVCCSFSSFWTFIATERRLEFSFSRRFIFSVRFTKW